MTSPASAPAEGGSGATVGHLVQMANQIAANFAHHPPDQAALEVAAHIRSFWAPAMRAQLEAWVESGGEGLHPLVIEAVRHLRESTSR